MTSDLTSIEQFETFAHTKIEDNSRAFKLQKANFDSEVNTAVRIDNYPDGSGYINPILTMFRKQKPN